MTLTNHLLTGAVLSKFLPWPIAVPLAFASHFVLDASPHFGFKTLNKARQHAKLWTTVLVIDILLAVVVSVWLIQAGHMKWFLTGLVAYSPDIIWIYRFTVEEKFGKVDPTPGNRFIQFHRTIQKYERPWGGFIEMLYAGILLIFLH